MERLTGSHDMSDWVVYKKSNPDVEVASSKNDVVNKTKCPRELLKKLDTGTDYILKLRYHDASNDLWSDYGSVEFRTKERFTFEGDPGHIGIPGTSTFGVGIAPKEVYESLGLKELPDTGNPKHFQYALYTKDGLPLQRSSGNPIKTEFNVKYIPRFYIAFLQDNYGNNLSDSQLQELVPYVEVTKEQMKEAQRRSPYNAMVVAPAKMFKNEQDANAHNFVLPAGFLNGGVEQPGFFIANTLTTMDGLGTSVNNLFFGESENTGNAHKIWRTTTDLKLASGIVNAYNCIDMPQLADTSKNFNCCTDVIWAVICILSLVQGQYAKSTSDCAWYDSGLSTNFPKGINDTSKDCNDSTVTSISMDSTNGSVFVSANYNKTTHNGSITGITNVNGWLWQFCLGYGYISGSYRCFKNTTKLSDITRSNVDSNNSFYETISTPLDSSNQRWGNSTKTMLFRDKNGQNRRFNCVFAPSGNIGSSGTNEFGNDYHYRGTSSGLIVGGNWGDPSTAGVFYRGSGDDWSSPGRSYGFRLVGYPTN